MCDQKEVEFFRTASDVFSSLTWLSFHYCESYYKSLIKHIKEEEACHRLYNLIDYGSINIKSAPAKHGRDLGHSLAWSSISIKASCPTIPSWTSRSILTLQPSMINDLSE